MKIQNVSLSVRYARDPFAISQTSGAYRDRVNIKQYVRNDVPTRSPCTTRLGSSSPDRDGEVRRPTSPGFPNINTDGFESIRIRFLQQRPLAMSPTLIFSAGSVSKLGTQNRDEDWIYGWGEWDWIGLDSKIHLKWSKSFEGLRAKGGGYHVENKSSAPRCLNNDSKRRPYVSMQTCISSSRPAEKLERPQLPQTQQMLRHLHQHQHHQPSRSGQSIGHAQEKTGVVSYVRE